MENGANVNEGIAGTEFKTPEEIVAALKTEREQRVNLEKKLGEQGNELGTLRQQTANLTETLKSVTGSKKEPAKSDKQAVDYDTEISKAKTELKGLDLASDDYSDKQAELVDRIANLTAQKQHDLTLNAAGEMMQKELGQRDVKAAQDTFRRENPTFDTPEMQAKIKDFMAKDKTGMHDSVSAFFQIQRDEVTAASATEKARLEAENAEMKKVIELNKGKDAAGKVIVKGQGPGHQASKQTKVTGKDLDASMAEALRKSRGET